VEESYLTRAISDPVRVKSFCRHASEEAWLEWISTKPAFRELFNRLADLSPAQWELARWFAQQHVVKGTGSALRVLGEMGGSLSLGLWHAIADAIWRERPSASAEFESWIAVLIDQLHDGDDHLLNYLARECRLPGDRRPLMMLLRLLFTPRLRVRPGIAWPGQPPRASVDVDVRADSHWMSEVLEENVIPHMDTVAEEVFEIATSALRQYHLIYRAFGEGSDDYDPLSFMRSAIEAHPQDRYNDDIALAIDFARESAIALARDRGVREVSDDLVARNVPILTRLAVWLVAQGGASGP